MWLDPLTVLAGAALVATVFLLGVAFELNRQVGKRPRGLFGQRPEDRP